MSENKMCAPYVDDLIRDFKGHEELLDEATQALVLELFKKMERITICGDDERRELWFCVPRGAIEDFGSYDEYREDGEVETPEEFEELWLSYYPDSEKWYHLVTRRFRDVHSVFFGGELVLCLMDDPIYKSWAHDKTEIAEWIINAVDGAIAALETEAYNKNVLDNLPYQKRLGKIIGNDFWAIYPENKAEWLKDISDADLTRFIGMMAAQPEKSCRERWPQMTSGMFFEACRLGYIANNFASTDTLSAKELYQKHADMRDEGLTDIAQDDPAAFEHWLATRKQGGHPWEVFRGGNSTHLSLYVHKDEGDWYFVLAGSSFARCVETAKFYLALVDAGYPVYLYEGNEIAGMMDGTAWIGIVPEDVSPRYCHSMFPGEKIIDFMNLPTENTQAVIAAAYWYPLDEVGLTEDENA
jgi:hypothetical protein